MPIYVWQIPTGLTEPLFALVVTLSAPLSASCRSSSSRLPSRVACAGLRCSSPGLVLYSVVGRVMKDDVLWLTSEANSLDSITYGRQGSVLHYFKLSPYLLGVPLVLLVLVGLGLCCGYEARRPAPGPMASSASPPCLMTGSFCALFVTYVAIWSLGIFDVIGDARRIARTGAGGGRHREARSSLGPGLPRQRRALKVGFVGVLSLLGRVHGLSPGWIRTGLGEESVVMRRGALAQGLGGTPTTDERGTIAPGESSGRVRTSCCLSHSYPIPR